MKGLLFVAIVLISGCSYITAEMQHVSHPFAGPPFGPTNEEDSLNSLNVCAQREQSKWFIEQCLGYKIGDGGFYGPDITYSARAGIKWRLGH